MRSPKGQKILRGLRAGACSLVALLFATTGVAQTNQKMIFRRLTMVKSPLELSTDYKNKPVDAKWKTLPDVGFRTQVFEADSDWLRNVTFKLKNVSGKRITYIALFLTFPETAKETSRAGLNLPSVQQSGTERVPGMHQIFVGVDPEQKFQRPALNLAPGETLEVSLAAEYPRISTLVRLLDFPMEQLNQMEVEIHAALFDDGTMDQGGMIYKRDPKDPHHYIPVGSAPFDPKWNQ
jgi:hypothetical protein